MRELLIATSNPGKFQEIVNALEGLPLKVFSLEDLSIPSFDFVEDGETFAENAAKKATHFAQKAGMMTLGEDSGIMVDCLEGELGVQTRRWGLGEDATDDEWLDYFMEKMRGVSSEKRGARFISNAFLLDPAEEIGQLFEGETKGYISEKILAPIMPGLPLSSVFIPEDFDKAYAELSSEEKNKLSHRGKAIIQVKEFLVNL